MNFSYFPLREFTEALAITSKVKVRLSTFINQLQKNNMQWMFQMFSQIYQYTVMTDGDINYKFNSLVALKLMLDTCQFPVVLMVEVYFLSQIRKIATYQLNLPQKQRGLDYFISQGYSKSQQTKKLGYNYVRLACQIISMLSVIKPNKLFRNQELSQASDFANTLQIMKAQLWKQYDVLAFYSQNGMKMRQYYLQKIELFDQKAHRYYDFFQSFLDKIIRKEYTPKGLDPRKILESCEVFACNFVMEVLKDMLQENKIIIIINILRLLTDFIKWGCIQAFYVIEVQYVFEGLLKMVKNGCRDVRTLERSKFVFSTLQATDQQRKLLYNQLMKSLQIWAVCIPRNLVNQALESKCSLIYKQFIMQLCLQFPTPGNVKKIKNQCDQNLQKNKQINRMIMKELKSTDFDLVHMKRSSSQLKELMRMDSNMLASLKSIISDARLISRRKNPKGHDQEDSICESSQGKKRLLASLLSSEDSQSRKVNFLDTFGSERKKSKYRTEYEQLCANKKRKSFNQILPEIKQRMSEVRLKTLPSQQQDSNSNSQEEITDIQDTDTDYSQEYDQNSQARKMRILKSDVGFSEIKQNCKNYNQTFKLPQIKSKQSESCKTDQSSRMEFFQQSFSSTSSFSSSKNNSFISQNSLNPKITINKIAKTNNEIIQKNMDQFISSKVLLTNNKQNQKIEQRVKMFKKVPTIKQYEQLQQKVQSLEQQKKQLRCQLQNKQKQLQKLKNLNLSTSSMKNNQFSWSFLYEDQQAIKTSNRISNNPKTGRVSNECLYIKNNKFIQQMEQLGKTSLKKLLKNKDLLLRNQRVQIGFIFTLQRYSSELVIFLTPAKDITNLKWSLQHKEGLSAFLQSDYFDKVSKKKQKKIIYQFQVHAPYGLPSFKLNYEMEKVSYEEQIILPLSFNKFLLFQPAPIILKEMPIIRKTTIDMLNKKIYKSLQCLKQYFPGLSIRQNSNEQKQVYGSFIFDRKHVNIRFIIQNDDFVQIECQLKKQDQILIEIAEFLLMTVLNLLKK